MKKMIVLKEGTKLAVISNLRPYGDCWLGTLAAGENVVVRKADVVRLRRKTGLVDPLEILGNFQEEAGIITSMWQKATAWNRCPKRDIRDLATPDIMPMSPMGVMG